jgi:hypothetical protein
MILTRDGSKEGNRRVEDKVFWLDVVSDVLLTSVDPFGNLVDVIPCVVLLIVLLEIKEGFVTDGCVVGNRSDGIKVEADIILEVTGSLRGRVTEVYETYTDIDVVGTEEASAQRNNEGLIRIVDVAVGVALRRSYSSEAIVVVVVVGDVVVRNVELYITVEGLIDGDPDIVVTEAGVDGIVLVFELITKR